MEIAWTTDLAEQLTWHWTVHVRPRLEGLTDDEYLWEPVPACWSVRPRAGARSAHPLGGDVVMDHERPEPDPAPLTTIAWRTSHLAGVFGIRATNHFGVDIGMAGYDTIDHQRTAAGGLHLLDRAYAAWTGGVAALGLDDLAAPCGPAEGPFAASPMAALVLHVNREAIHHAAEILLLRDLYIRTP